jgi:hypothetical protein
VPVHVIAAIAPTRMAFTLTARLGSNASGDPNAAEKRTINEAKDMNVGESVVLVRRVDGVEEGTRGWVKHTNADEVVVECKVRERLALVLTHTWDLLPERLWERLMRHRTKRG